jgi:uncharacterized protein
MSESIQINFAEPIGLFPLPECVLLPHATIPLHIFEQRYRQMVKDALDSTGLIAMAVFEGNGWKQNYEGAPPLRPVACVGYIVQHDRMFDGRYNILLQGVCRAVIAEEVEQGSSSAQPLAPYRRAKLVPMENQVDDEGMLLSTRTELLSLLSDPDITTLASIGKIGEWIDERIPTPAAVDVVGHVVAQGNFDRYELLSEPDFFARASRVEGVLRAMRRSLRIASKFKPTDLTDGMNMN